MFKFNKKLLKFDKFFTIFIIWLRNYSWINNKKSRLTLLNNEIKKYVK
jgi:hypothetical protein